MKKILILILWLIVANSIVAQESSLTGNTWNKTTEISVNYSSRKVLSSAGVSKEGIILVKTLAEEMFISIPSDGLDKLKIQFNKKESENFFQLTFSCKESKQCESFSISDLSDGILKLTFYNGELIKIGNRSINPRKIDVKEPYIQLIIENETRSNGETEMKPYDLKTDAKQEILPEVDKTTLNENITCFTCNTGFPVCEEIKNKPNSSPESNEKIRKNSQSVRKNKYSTIICEIDPVTNSQTWIERNKDGIEYIVEDAGSIHPWAGSDFTLRIKGLDTEKYLVTISGESSFMEGSEDLKNVFSSKATQPKSVKSSSDSTSSNDATQEKDRDIPRPKEISASLALKGKLLALDKILEKFNSDYASIDFNEVAYHKELSNLMQGIKNCLSIPLKSDPDELEISLKMIVKSLASPSSFDEFLNLIAAIKGEYKNVFNKTTNRKLFTITKQVPDEDRMSISLQTDKTKDKILDYNFAIKGGFKIDFSSGFFINGLGSPEFILQKFNFSYRESKDSVVITGGQPKDTVIYTGKTNTTSGNLINTNKNILNYGAGFFAHAYRRSGKPFNWGLGLGGALNNTGQITGMLGLSAMLNAGKGNRIALIGGPCIGKVKNLSTSELNFMVKEEHHLADNGRIIFPNLHEVPKFHDSGDVTTINTYDKWQISWFLGISFNFATVNVTK